MLDGLTEKIREIESGGRVLYRRDYRISSEKQMPNLRSRRGEGCSLDRVQKVYAAGSILGARRPTQIEFCIGSDSSADYQLTITAIARFVSSMSPLLSKSLGPLPTSDSVE